MKIGIFGGTFNPIHNGHLINGQHILEEFHLEKVVFIPSRVPVHKKLAQDISPDIRMRLLDLAIEDNPAFESSSIEIDSPHPSYTIETLNQLSRTCNIDELSLIIGADSLNTMDRWWQFEEIFNSIEIIVMKRPGDEDLRQDILDMSDRIKIADNPLIGISSSDIRELLKKNRNIQYLVPTKVYQEIIEKDLYLQ